MLGYNLIGYSSLGEPDVRLANVTIMVPALTMNLGAADPVGGIVSVRVGIEEVQFDLGGIGSSLIGVDAILEGSHITKEINVIPSINAVPLAPADIQTGVQIELPVAIQMTMQMHIGEIDSRRRKLRTQTILS
jgi:hypothetical protein